MYRNPDETPPGARKGKLTAATLTGMAGMAVNLLMWLHRSATIFDFFIFLFSDPKIR